MIVNQSVLQLSSNVYQQNISNGFKVVSYNLDNKQEYKQFILDKVNNITSQMIWKDGKRTGDNFISADHIVLDFDDPIIEDTKDKTTDRINSETINEILNAIRDIQPIDVLIYPSKSHNLEKISRNTGIKTTCPRYHAIIFFDKPITDRDEYDMIMNYFMSELKIVKTDTAVKDRARYMNPSFKTGESIRPEVQEGIDELIDFIMVNDEIEKVDTNIILNICREIALNDSKTIQNEISNIDLTNIEKNDEIMSMIDSLRGKDLDHMERWYIACYIKRVFGYETMRSIILSIDSKSEGNQRIFDVLKKSSSKSNATSIGSLIYLAKKYGWTYADKIDREYKPKLAEIELQEEQIKNSDMTNIKKEEEKVRLSNEKIKLLKEKEIKIEKLKINNYKDEMIARLKYKTDIIVDLNAKSLDDCKHIDFFNSFCGITTKDEVVIQTEDGIEILPRAKGSSYFNFLKLIITDDKDSTKTKVYKLFDLWYEDIRAKRLRKDGIIFKPNYIANYNEINLYDENTIYSVKRVKYTDRIGVYKEYLSKVLGYDDEYKIEYNKLMLDGIVQLIPIGINPTFVGAQGVGKSTLAEKILMKIIDPKYTVKQSDASHVYGEKNGILEHKLLVVLDEANINKPEYLERRKDYATSSVIGCRGLYKESKTIDKLFNTITILNSDDTKKINATYVATNRRDYYIEPNSDYSEILIDDNGDQVKNSKSIEFFDRFYSLLKDDTFIGEILDYHMENKFDVDEFRKMEKPVYNVLREESSKHMDLTDQWIYQLYENGGEIIADDISINLFDDFHKPTTIHQSYVEFCQRLGSRDTKNVISFMIFLNRRCKCDTKKFKGMELKKLDSKLVKKHLIKSKYITD